MKRLSTLFICFFPNKLAIFFLNLIGHSISYRAHIGFSIIYCKYIKMDANTRIGNFNFIKVSSISLEKGAYIGILNYFKGPFKIELASRSRIRKQNKFTSAYFPVTYGVQKLILGKGTGVTSGNYFDLTNSIIFGENSQVAGIGSQFWTHGYMHADTGTDRIRIDGDITIGNNVYIGSRCLFNPGVNVADAINIGGNSVISKNLTKPGMYVNQILRHIETNIDIARNKFDKINVKDLAEEVYTKSKKL